MKQNTTVKWSVDDNVWLHDVHNKAYLHDVHQEYLKTFQMSLSILGEFQSVAHPLQSHGNPVYRKEKKRINDSFHDHNNPITTQWQEGFSILLKFIKFPDLTN